LLCNQVELLPVARDSSAYLNSVVLPKASGREMSARRWLRGSGKLRMIEEAKWRVKRVRDWMKLA
jgi:hypothetical protein